MKIEISVGGVGPVVRADYWAALIADELLIIDEDRGNMSVTNDLEAVLLEIWRDLVPTDQDMPDLIIRYRDTGGTWDRIVVRPIEGSDTSFTAQIFSGQGDAEPDLELFKKPGVATVSFRV